MDFWSKFLTAFAFTFCALAIVAAILAAVDCDKKGGVLVRGLFWVECINVK